MRAATWGNTGKKFSIAFPFLVMPWGYHSIMNCVCSQTRREQVRGATQAQVARWTASLGVKILKNDLV